MKLCRMGVLVTAAGALALLSPSYAALRHSTLDRLPGLVLWAWERPEDLRGLAPDMGVAFLAQTLVVDSDRLQVVPRRQPLRVSPTTSLVAVTRIESVPNRSTGPALARETQSLRSDIVHAIAGTSSLPQVVGVQVDFDAVLSERAFYARVLRELKPALDPAIVLSMTALASWCMDDDWLRGLPVDEVVPMLFRMGASQPGRQRAAASLQAAACRGSVGTALDEPTPLPSDRRRVYVFSPKPWTEALVAEARRAAR
jgi:hypothetical protein